MFRRHEGLIPFESTSKERIRMLDGHVELQCRKDDFLDI